MRGGRENSGRHYVCSWAFKFKKVMMCVFYGAQFQKPSSRRVAISKGSCQRRWMDCCGSSFCNIRGVVHGNTRVMNRSRDISPQAAATSTSSQESSCTCIQSSLYQNELSMSNVHQECDSQSLNVSSRRSKSAHFMMLLQQQTDGMLTRDSSSMSISRKWYECHMTVDPLEAFALAASICACPSCGQIFSNTEDLEEHQAIRHAVSVLGEEDSARTVVEIIFQSSWLKKESPICKIERILKIHSSQRTISKFEEYRDMVKAKEGKKVLKKDPRCMADGNELRGFFCTRLACSLGTNAENSSLCNLPSCNTCSVIRNGFCPTRPNSEIAEKGKGFWVYTTASSAKAHDSIQFLEEELETGKGKRKRAMLVCRMIAGRVQKSHDDADFIAGGFDSIAGHCNLEELFLYQPSAVLPCFVVIYQTL
eukprot:PITA_27339